MLTRERNRARNIDFFPVWIYSDRTNAGECDNGDKNKNKICEIRRILFNFSNERILIGKQTRSSK